MCRPPAIVAQRLSAELEESRETLRILDEDLVAFRDPDRLRATLKHDDPARQEAASPPDLLEQGRK